MEPLTFLIMLALLATVVSLALGIGSMVRGGEYDRSHSTRFMSWRVGAQVFTFVLLLIAFVAANL